MQRNKNFLFKLYLLAIIFLIIEISINSYSIIYVDIIGIFLTVLLINKLCLFRQLIIIALAADLIGRWYLGTHLFAIVLISFISDKYYNFYKLSGTLQKIISVIIFTGMQFAITAIIGLLTHNIRIDLLSLATEFIILCPLIFLISSKVLKNVFSDIIFT